MSVQRFVRRVPHPVGAGAGRADRLRRLAVEFSGHAFTWGRSSWVDLAWVAFVALNLLAMRLLPACQTMTRNISAISGTSAR